MQPNVPWDPVYGIATAVFVVGIWGGLMYLGFRRLFFRKADARRDEERARYDGVQWSDMITTPAQLEMLRELRAEDEKRRREAGEQP